MHIIRKPFFRWTGTALLLAIMGWQLWHRSDQFQNFHIISWWHTGWYLVLVLLLMPVNWWLESAKWHHLLSVHAQMPFGRAVKAVAGGIALSIFTPNRIGEYGGRMMFMPYRHRWPVVFSTLIGSVSQNLVAFGAGILSFMILFEKDLWLQLGAAFCFLACVVAYFFIGKTASWIVRFDFRGVLKKMKLQIHHLGDYKKDILGKALLIAALRYFVYVLQFVIVLLAFEPQSSVLYLFLGVSCLYLFHTFVPLPAGWDVLARTNIALLLWSGTGMSELSISLASFIVWMVNLLIPALFGSLAIGTIDVKKSFSTHDRNIPTAFEPAIPDALEVRRSSGPRLL